MLQEPSYSKRFKSVSDAEIQDLKERRQSKATKSNTKWGLNLFQGKFMIQIFNEMLKLKISSHHHLHFVHPDWDLNPNSPHKMHGCFNIKLSGFMYM